MSTFVIPNFQGSNARNLKLCLTWKRRASQGSKDFLGIIESARQKCSYVETHLNRLPNEAFTATDSECEEVFRYMAAKEMRNGYEADTDDTLTRRKKRGSVKEIAKRFQEAENLCPSPWPLRPRPSSCLSESEYESDAEMMKWRTRSDGGFQSSRAYVPPKWAPSEAKETNKKVRLHEKSETQTRSISLQQQTKVIRFNSQEIQQHQSDSGNKTTSSSLFNLDQFNNQSAKNLDSLKQLKESEEFVEKMKSQVAEESSERAHVQKEPAPKFKPSKFVPGTMESRSDKWTFGAGGDTDKIKPVWAPSDSETEEPCYRKIRYCKFTSKETVTVKKKN
jgi:hypothetical protein